MHFEEALMLKTKYSQQNDKERVVVKKCTGIGVMFITIDESDALNISIALKALLECGFSDKFGIQPTHKDIELVYAEHVRIVRAGGPLNNPLTVLILQALAIAIQKNQYFLPNRNNIYIDDTGILYQVGIHSIFPKYKLDKSTSFAFLCLMVFDYSHTFYGAIGLNSLSKFLPVSSGNH